MAKPKRFPESPWPLRISPEDYNAYLADEARGKAVAYAFEQVAKAAKAPLVAVR